MTTSAQNIDLREWLGSDVHVRVNSLFGGLSTVLLDFVLNVRGVLLFDVPDVDGTLTVSERLRG